VIAVEGVTKRYGELVAVDDVSFEVSPGEVVGFLGPNGAGKSTTMKVLTGIMQPDEGAVRFDGRSIGEDPPAARRRVGYLPETNALYADMLVSEYLAYACQLRDIQGARQTRALARAAEKTGVGPVFTRPVSELSKGFRQRVGLAAAIVHEPEILVLDEPTEGLDPNQRVGIRKLVRDLGRDRTVILSTHVLAEVEATCDRLLIIHQGRIVADGSAETLLAERGSGARYVMEAEGEGVGERLEALPGVTSVATEPVDGRVRATVVAGGTDDLRPVLFRAATEEGWVLWELHRERESLERLFQVLTAEGGDR
jgi:ABC-2 type transport system ATP-binding protein